MDVSVRSKPKPPRRRWPRVLLVVVLVLVALAAGAALGFPLLVESQGREAIAKLEDRLEVTMSAERVDWRLSGQVEVSGLVVRDAHAPAGEPPLFSARRVHVESDVDLLARRVKVLRVVVDGAEGHLLRRADGALNVAHLVEGVRALFGGGSGGGGAGGAGFLERHLPEVTLHGATIVTELPPPTLPFGLEIPRRIELTGGEVSAKPEQGDDGSARVVVEASFAASSLDPGRGLSASFTATLDGRPEAVAARFERPVRFYLGQRVAGFSGVSWSPEGFRVDELQLSVPFDPNARQDTVGAALTVGSLSVRPEPRELLARVRAARAAAGEGEGGALDPKALLLAADEVVVASPAMAVRFASGGHHSFEDLVPALPLDGPLARPTVAPEPDGPLQLLTNANLAASARLTHAGARAAPAEEALDTRVAAVFSRLDAAGARAEHLLGRLLDGLPVKHLEITHGELAVRDAGDATYQLRGLGFTARQGAGGAASIELSVEVDDVTREPLKLTLRRDKAGDPPVLDLVAAGLPLAAVARALPGPLARIDRGVLDALELHLRPSARGFEVDGEVSFSGLRVLWPAIAVRPLANVDGRVKGHLGWDRDRQTLTVAEGRLERGGLAIGVSGTVTRALTRPRLQLSLRLPKTPVQAVVDALPAALLTKLDGLAVSGELTWAVDVALDTSDIDGLTIDSRPELEGFLVRSMGHGFNLENLRYTVTYPVKTADGAETTRTTGPLSASWVPLEGISRYVPLAVTTTEDPFYRHNGISTNAIRESIVANLKRERFVRGASTITQQLVKNLFLGPQKTIARKLQEMFIAWRLEETLSKDEILALYLNVIEFGPGIYGIGDAAARYFGKSPGDLTALESVFLASIIPSPRRYYSFFAEGAVSPRWRSYLGELLAVMVSRGKITSEEAESQAPYEPLFSGQGGGDGGNGGPYPDAPEDDLLLPEDGLEP